MFKIDYSIIIYSALSPFHALTPKHVTRDFERPRMAILR